MPGFNFPNLESKASSKAAFVFSAVLVVSIGFIAYAGDNLEIKSADSKGCDITKTTAAQGCCKCDTGSMCLAENGKYRVCADGCYTEKTCPAGDEKNNGLCSQLTQCPGAVSACAKPGEILNPAQNPKIFGAGGAAYLQVCGTDYSVAKIQCGFTLSQKKAIACFETVGGSLTPEYGRNDGDGFTIGYGALDTGKVNALDEKIFASILGIRDANGFTKCDDIPSQQSLQAAAESVRKSLLGCAPAKQTGGSDTCQNLELACCLTNDHCKSYGCDENIVYDWYYGCTKIDFGKAGFANAKLDSAGSGEVCAPRTFGCGKGISDAGYYKVCQPSVSNIHYWSENKKCDPNPNPTIGNCAQEDYCAHFGCDGSLAVPLTWDNYTGDEKCQAALSKTADPGLCPTSKCMADSGQIKHWDGKSKVPDCKYVDSQSEKQFGCKKCHDDGALNKAVCDSSSDGDKKLLLSCDKGAALCGYFCYNQKSQQCLDGTIFCKTATAAYDDTFNAAINYYPRHICNSDHTAVELFVPNVSSYGRDGVCEYEAYHVCHVDEKCAKGRCVKNADNQSNKELGIPARYDYKTETGVVGSVNMEPGKLIDRDSGNILDLNLAKCGVKYPLLAAVVGDARGCDNLNAALALVGSYNVKDKTWNEEHDAQGNLLYGPLTGTYNCTNFTDNTIKMLRNNNFKEAYAVSLTGADAAGAGQGHAVVAIKTGDIQYNDKTTIPTFVLIEPQSGKIIGQLGNGDNSVVVDCTNSQSEPLRIDDAVVIGNYEYEDSRLHFQQLTDGDANIYSYTFVTPSVSDEKCISISHSYKICPASVQ